MTLRLPRRLRNCHGKGHLGSKGQKQRHCSASPSDGLKRQKQTHSNGRRLPENDETKPNCRGESRLFQNQGGGNVRSWRLQHPHPRVTAVASKPSQASRREIALIRFDSTPFRLSGFASRGKMRERAERKSQKQTHRSSDRSSRKYKNKATSQSRRTNGEIAQQHCDIRSLRNIELG